jgi:hypothetical protein
MNGEIAITVIATGFPFDTDKYKARAAVTVGEAMRAAAVTADEVEPMMKNRGPMKIKPQEEVEYEDEEEEEEEEVVAAPVPPPPARRVREPEPVYREDPPPRRRNNDDDDVPDFMNRLRRKK